MPITEGGQFAPDAAIISPGVFTRELDQTGIAAGIQNIGGVIVAPFSMGPAFSPMSFTNVNQLQSTFGTPDGVYYGPYTAIQYLQQQGIVTICRVGALTGYHQDYPFHIWAVKGTYQRTASYGSLNPVSSYLYFSGSLTDNGGPYNSGISWSSTYSSSVSASHLSGAYLLTYNSYTSSVLTFESSSFTVTFAPGAADNTAQNLSGSNANSGSILYYGQTVTLGSPNGYFGYANSNQPQTSYSSSVSNNTQSYFVGYGFNQQSFSSSITTGNNNSFSASISGNIIFNNAVAPFAGATLISSSFTVNTNQCGFPLFLLSGIVTGAFGQYDGFISNGTPTFNPCIGPNGSWVTQSGADMRLLAVLADTEAGGIENLIAPGFFNSTMSLVNNSNGIVGPLSPTNLATSIPNTFNLSLFNSNSPTPYGTYQFSLNSSQPNYITNVFGSNPAVGNPATQVQGQKIEAAYLYAIYEDRMADIVANPTTWGIFGAALPSASITGEPLDFIDQYSLNPTQGDSQFAIRNAITPSVVSQQIAPWQAGGNPTRFNLFQVATIADGTYTNTQFKVQISNVKLAGQVAGSNWGSFTLTLRQFGDTDKSPQIVEQYNNLTLDPDSDNYLPLVIGDQYTYINNNGKVVVYGIYPNQSQNIYILMSGQNYPKTAIPYGFNAYSTPTNGAMGYWTPPMAYSKASVYGLNPGKYPSGINFGDAPTGADTELLSLYPTLNSGSVGTATDNLQYFAPSPSFSENGVIDVSIGRNVAFALDINYKSFNVGTGSFLTSSMANVVGNIVPAIYDPVNESTYQRMRNFVFGFQGGFDGQSPAIPINVGANISAGNTQGLDCTTVNSAGSVAYNQCITVLGNADQYDINLIVTPGIIYQLHPYVTNLVVDMCTTRGDVFYILDLYLDSGNPPTNDAQIDTVVSYAAQFDTNYAAAYYPWVTILDTYNNLHVTVPPSVLLPSVYAANDAIGAEWFAPAGLNRGTIPVGTGVTDRTTHQERDILYQGKVNPIATFPGQGVVVWGQKTLQNANSALNRINVRRLLINLKKFFASVSQYLIFEQNVASTRNKFLSIANPYCEAVQQRSGLYAFYIKMDDSNNTPDIVDQNILYGQIYIQPTRTAEFIILDFNILPQGASFPNM